MEWVAIDVSIAGDPGVHRMADALRVRVPEVVGLLGLTFAGMAQHAQDGQLGSVTDTLLEQWAHWHGKRGAFATQFRAELCDESGRLRTTLVRIPKRPRSRPQIPRRVRDFVIARDGYRCRGCGHLSMLQLDHVEPWSLGGSDKPENLQLLCGPCNRRKGPHAYATTRAQRAGA